MFYEDVFRHTVSEAAKLGVNVFPAVVYADCETAIHSAVTTAWPGLEIKACRFHVRQSSWRKIHSLGLSKQYGKKNSELSQFLKKIFGLSVLPPTEVCDCLTLEFLCNFSNDKRVETFLHLPARKLYWWRLHISSFCLVRLYCIITEDHKRIELFHAHFNALFYSAHHKIFVLVSALQKIQNEIYITMRSVTIRRFRKSATFKQEDLISPKSGQYSVNLISRIEFVSSVLYKFLSNTHL